MPESHVGFLLYEWPSPTQTFVADQVESLLGAGVRVTVFVRRLPFTILASPVRHAVYERIAARVAVIDLGDETRWGRGEQLARLAARTAGAFARDPRAAWRLVRSALSQPGPLKRRLAALLRAAPLAGRRLDLLHAHFGWSLWGWSDLAARLELPLVVTLYGADVTLADGEGARGNAEIFAAADALVCTSAFLRERALAQGADPERVSVLYPRVDCDFFAPDHAAPLPASTGSPPILVTVARLHWKKGLLDGLRAIAELRSGGRELRWRILGAGPEEPALRAAIADLGLSGAVDLAGACERRAVRDALREATLFVLPSVREELGLAAAEALACGVPVVATRVGGVAEIVEPERSGLLVPARDAAALAKAIATLLDDPTLRAAAGAHGRAHVQRRFDAPGAEDALPALYERVLAARKRKAPAWR